VLCTSSLLILVLKLEFFAIIFILIYVGVIVVFFVFTVMLLNLRFDFQIDITIIDFYLSLINILIFNLFIDYFIINDFTFFNRMELSDLYIPLSHIPFFINDLPILDDDTFFINEYQLFFFSIKYFGFFLYTKFGLYMFIVSLVLLISLLGSIQIIKFVNNIYTINLFSMDIKGCKNNKLNFLMFNINSVYAYENSLITLIFLCLIILYIINVVKVCLKYKQYNEERRKRTFMESVRLKVNKRWVMREAETKKEEKDYLKLIVRTTGIMDTIHYGARMDFDERLSDIGDIFEPLIDEFIRSDDKKLLMRFTFVEPSPDSKDNLGIYAISVLNKEYIHPKYDPIIQEKRARHKWGMQHLKISMLSTPRRQLFEYLWSKYDLFVYKPLLDTGMKCMTGEVSQINFYFNLNSNLLYFYLPADKKGFALLKQLEENKFWKDNPNHKGKRKPDFADPILLSCELINIKEELESKTTLHTCYTHQEFKEKYPKDFINNPSTLFFEKDSYGWYEDIKVPTTDEILAFCEVCDDPEAILVYYQSFYDENYPYYKDR
jgi:NADH:ubiquinone oxidoreductase subunit 6 (chain J)